MSSFDILKERDLLMHKDLYEESHNGIKMYIEGRAKWIDDRHKRKNFKINKNEVEELASKADGLFIWVKTVFGKSKS